MPNFDNVHNAVVKINPGTEAIDHTPLPTLRRLDSKAWKTSIAEVKPEPSSNAIPPGSANGKPLSAGLLRDFGEFHLIEVLGKGGMGIVYRAEESKLDRDVAVKVMHRSLADSREFRARFLREARAQASIEHDRVVPIYRVGEVDGVPFITMPVLKGISLAQYLKSNNKPSLKEVIQIGIDLATGLAAAHEKGVIHRDIKPGNIWLELPSGRVKILDFGMARESVTAGDPTDPFTSLGMAIGTTEYMSPEQARGDTLDARTDLFSMGVVLYELATGTQPFHGPSRGETLARVKSQHVVPPIELNPLIPEVLNRIIFELLNKTAHHRPASAKDVANALQSIDLNYVDNIRVTDDKVLAKRRIWNRLLKVGVLSSILIVSLAISAFVSESFLESAGLGGFFSKSKLDNPATALRLLQKDFDTVVVRNEMGDKLEVHEGTPLPEGTFEIEELLDPQPLAGRHLRRKVESTTPDSLQSIRRIQLRGSNVTDRDLDEIAKHLPQCVIE